MLLTLWDGHLEPKNLNHESRSCNLVTPQDSMRSQGTEEVECVGTMDAALEADWSGFMSTWDTRHRLHLHIEKHSVSKVACALNVQFQSSSPSTKPAINPGPQPELQAGLP